MDAKNADCATRRALIRAFNEGEVTHKLDGKTTRHSIRATAATAFIGTTAAAAAVFCPYGAFEHLRLPASCCQPAMAARAPGYAGRTSWPLPAAVSAPWARATPWRRVTKRTVMPGSNVSSIRRIGHRHGCMPLAKWETGSGQFGGCLIKIDKLGRSRPGIQATSPIFDPLGVARLPLFGNFSYSAFFAPC